MKTYHFCAEFNEAPGVMHVFDGVATSDVDVLDKLSYDRLKEKIASAMTPARPVKSVVIRSLSVLG